MMQPRPKTLNSQLGPSRPRRQRFLEKTILGLALLVAPAILAETNLPAQTHTTQAIRPAQQQVAAVKPTQPRRAAAHSHAVSTKRQPAPEPIVAQLPASPAPIWPANQPPNRARVSWDSRGLEIEASNSSLNQILRQVAFNTGAKLEGLAQDQRIFGSYGPGPASDVLMKLLDGSGYNVLMIGGRDADPPLQIVLSSRSSANPQTVANNQNRSNSEDDKVDEQIDPDPPNDSTESPRPEQVQNPFRNGNSELPHDPVEFMQEILQRQQKIDQQTQQDQQNNPQ